MKRALVAAAFASASLAALPALAQPQPYPDRGPDHVRRELDTTPTYPDRVEGDRRPQNDPRSIDPAPGATRPYVGVGPQRFYDVEDHIARVEARLASLPARQRKAAYAQMRSIRAEEQRQKARHGGQLRDWDRENLSKRLEALVHRYPELGR